MAYPGDTVLAALILAAMFFFWQRNRRRRAEAQRKALLREQHTHMFDSVMVPKGHIPPSYQDAVYSPYMADNSHASDHQKLMDDCMRAAYDAEDGTTTGADQRKQQQPRTDDALMDDCMRAVYDAENGVAHSSTYGNASTSVNSQARASVLAQPTNPRGAALGDAGRSVSRWFRNQRWIPGSGNSQHPLASHPSSATRRSSQPSSPAPGFLPTAPSPSYSGIPSTPSTARSATGAPLGHLPSPHQRHYLTPLVSPYPAGPHYSGAASPLPSAQSATSWMTGEDRLSIRASIPHSVLYPSPLQPAPPGRRRMSPERGGAAGVNADRVSVSSAEGYGAGTWRTMTPHEDPPEYEPRRGRPEEVSPV